MEANYNTSFMEGGGEMGSLIRAKNWDETPLGPIAYWPQSLRTTLAIVLHSKFSMFILWGPELICFYNDAYRPSLGNNGKHPGILGMPAKEAWPEIWDIIYPLIMQVMETGEATWSEDQLIPIYRNGMIEDVYWTFSYSSLRDEYGTASGVLVTCTETTEKVLNQAKLQESKDQLEFTIDAAEMGTWDIDLQTNTFSCNWRVKEWMGLPDENSFPFSLAASAVAPADKERVSLALKKASTYHSGGIFEEVYSLHNLKTGNEIIVRSKGKTVFDDQRKPMRFVGLINDVTNELADQQRIAESERNMRAMLKNAPVSIAILRGSDHVVDMVNERALLMWGKEEVEVQGKSIFEVMPELISQGFREQMDAVFSTGIPFEATERLIKIRVNGELQDVYSNFSYEPLFDTEGKVSGILAIGVEVTDQVIARKKIEKSALQIRAMVEHAPFPIGLYEGEEMRIELVNQSILDVWGKGNNVAGKLYADVLPELENQEVFDQLKQVYRTGKSFSAKNRELMLNVNGKMQRFFFNYNFTPLHDANGKVFGVMNTAADVTDLNIAKLKIEASEKRFRNTVQKAPVAITILQGKDHIVELANETYLELVSRKEEDFVGKPLYESLPEVKDAVDPLLKKVLETGEPYFGREFPVTINRNGVESLAYVNFIYQALREESGEITGIIVVATDVTDTVNARQSLAQSEEQFRNLVMQSPIAMTIFVGNDFVIDIANTVMYEKIWRKERKDVEGKKLLDVFPELADQKYPELLRQVMRTGQMHSEIESEALVMGSDGMRKFYLDFEYAPLFETGNVVSGIMVTVNDVTEKVEARLKLEEAENRLRLAAEATELATWDLDLRTQAAIYAPRMSEIFGHGSRTDIPYTNFRNQVYTEDLENVVNKAYQEALETGVYKYEARILRPDNTTRWIRTQGSVFYDDKKVPIKLVGTVRDITEEKSFQQNLEESELKFRLLADSMPQHIWTADPTGQLNYFNQSVYDFSGLTPQQMEEGGWLQIVHPDDRQLNIDKWNESVQQGKDYIFEQRFRRHDGQYRWQLSRAIPQRDAEGKIQMWVGTSTDIHNQKTFTDELERQVFERTSELQLKNRELEKMNTELQSFAYVSSHDLQEPLRKIQTFANRLLERETDNLSETGKDYFLRMQKAARRMQTLIEDLLAYSRTSTSERNFETIPLNEIVDQVLYELRDDIQQKQANIKVDDLGHFSVIPFQFRQLIHNLIGNSLKFTRPDVIPLIKIEHSMVKGSRTGVEELAPDKEYYHLTVSDNGIGFEEQYEDRIFEVFQRLHGKEEYKGTGIGLAIVKKIVENHYGFIRATGRLNQGARFDIYFPV